MLEDRLYHIPTFCHGLVQLLGFQVGRWLVGPFALPWPLDLLLGGSFNAGLDLFLVRILVSQICLSCRLLFEFLVNSTRGSERSRKCMLLARL